jgi:ABC-2 type transport system permease protein
MNLKRVKAITKKEFIQIIRDPRSLALGIFIPILLLILFGYALTLDVDNIPVAVWDQDKSQISADFIFNFKSSRYFKIIGYFDDYHQLQSLIDNGQALMVMVIPYNFSKKIMSNEPAQVQLIVDGSDSNTATIALGYAEGLIAGYNAKFVIDSFSKLGIKQSPAVDARSRVWFNEDLKSRNYIIPGLIVVIMMIIAALLTSLTVAREWERGTMEQLISTPVKAGELVLGKFLPYFIIGFVDLLIAVAMAQFIYHVPFRGSFLLLFILSSLFLTGALCQGMFISITAKNQLMASQMAILSTFLPAFLLSGFAYAISNMPKAVQAITYIFPARYFVAILRSIYLKGVGLKFLWLDVFFLLAFTFIMITAAKRRFKKKVA